MGLKRTATHVLLSGAAVILGGLYGLVELTNSVNAEKRADCRRGFAAENTRRTDLTPEIIAARTSLGPKAIGCAYEQKTDSNTLRLQWDPAQHERAPSLDEVARAVASPTAAVSAAGMAPGQ